MTGGAERAINAVGAEDRTYARVVQAAPSNEYNSRMIEGSGQGASPIQFGNGRGVNLQNWRDERNYGRGGAVRRAFAPRPSLEYGRAQADFIGACCTCQAVGHRAMECP